MSDAAGGGLIIVKEEKMTMQEFSSIEKEAVSEKLGTGYHVTIQEVPKINGTSRTGVTMRMEGLDIAPTVYLDSYFAEHLLGRGIEEVVNEVASVGLNHHPGTPDLEGLKQFASIKDRIVTRLVNYEMNQVLLESVPHQRFLDLAIVAYVLMDCDCQGSATIMIRDKHLELWNVGEEKVFACAKTNMPRLLPPKMLSIGEAICEFSGAEVAKEGHGFCDSGLSVLTNDAKQYGAICFLYDGILRKLAQKHGTDIAILPSSVHEVLLMPSNFTRSIGRDGLYEMVSQVNKMVVDEGEVLSNSVYLYERTSDSVQIM